MLAPPAAGPLGQLAHKHADARPDRRQRIDARQLAHLQVLGQAARMGVDRPSCLPGSAHTGSHPGHRPRRRIAGYAGMAVLALRLAIDHKVSCVWMRDAHAVSRPGFPLTQRSGGIAWPVSDVASRRVVGCWLTVGLFPGE